MPSTTRATIRTQCFKGKSNWKHFCEPGWAHTGFSKHADTVLNRPCSLPSFFLSFQLPSFFLLLLLLSLFSTRGRVVVGLGVDRVTYMRIQSRTKLLDLLQCSNYAGLCVLSGTTLVESNPRLLSLSSHGRALPLEQTAVFLLSVFFKGKISITTLPRSRAEF